MIRTSISLPKKYRLELTLAKRRRDSIADPLLPSISDIKKVRNGSRFSRVFTHIFSHKHVKKILGANIAFAIVMAGFVPAQANFSNTNEINIIAAENIVTTTKSGVAFPIEEPIKLNQGYWAFHPGLDIDGEIGDPINSIMAGTVSNIQHSNFSYGNAIIVDHGSGLTSLYAHLSKIEVGVGDSVTNSTEIGKMGSTGHSTGPHLHLEVHQDGRPINPLTILPKIAK